MAVSEKVQMSCEWKIRDAVCSPDRIYLPSAVTKQPEIDAAVPEVAGILAPDAVHIRYEICQDWSGEWAVCFWVILSDDAGQENCGKSPRRSLLSENSRGIPT